VNGIPLGPDTGVAVVGQVDRTVIRKIELPGERTLLIRRETPADAGALAALYDRLAEDDRYCRFFSARRPPDPFIERMTKVYDRGGVGLVAVLSERPGVERIVGEASCELQPDGDGELGITVESFARGWLGPYLLDTLVEQARSRGLRNIQAEVLMANRRILAVLRSRGMVTLDFYNCPATMRVAIGAAQRIPSWSGRHDRPRILLEVPGGTWYGTKALREVGFQVVACAGPAAFGGRCPALDGQPCPLAAGADAVVVGLPTSTETGSALVDAHRRLHPKASICALDRGEGAGSGGDLPCLPAGPDGPAMVDFLERLIARGQSEEGFDSDSSGSEAESDIGP